MLLNVELKLANQSVLVELHLHNNDHINADHADHNNADHADHQCKSCWSSSELHGSELANLSKLVELHLHNNRLRSIEKDTFANLTSLQVNIIMVILIITFVIITIKFFILIIFIIFVFVVIPCFIPCQMAQSSSWWSVGGVDYRVSHKKLMLLLGSSGSAKRSRRHR